MGNWQGAGGGWGEEGRGERISWFSAQTAFSSKTQYYSRAICFLDVGLERDHIPEALVDAFQGITSGSQTDPSQTMETALNNPRTHDLHSWFKIIQHSHSCDTPWGVFG